VHHLRTLQSARAATCLVHPFPACPSRGKEGKAVCTASPLQSLRVFRSAAGGDPYQLIPLLPNQHQFDETVKIQGRHLD